MNRYPNPRSQLDVERTKPIIDDVKKLTSGMFRPQLLRVTAYRDEKLIGDTLVSHESIQSVIISYPDATHLTIEHLGSVR